MKADAMALVILQGRFRVQHMGSGNFCTLAFLCDLPQVTLIEKPESRTPKRTRIHIMLERAEKLAGSGEPFFVAQHLRHRSMGQLPAEERLDAVCSA